MTHPHIPIQFPLYNPNIPMNCPSIMQGPMHSVMGQPKISNIVYLNQNYLPPNYNIPKNNQLHLSPRFANLSTINQNYNQSFYPNKQQL